MRIMNPFQMNDWNIKHIFIFVLVVQIILLVTAGLNNIGLNIPIIQVIAAFISLIYLNGILILRILKIHGLGNIENFLYAVGLSIAVGMFFGMLINLTYPFLGITKPISLIPLIITFTIFTGFLLALSYMRDRTYDKPTSIDLTGIINPILVFTLLPFLAIFGTSLMNYYHNNIILIFMYILIAILPLLAAFKVFLPKKLYPFAIFSIALSLLFSTSLLSSYITGWDINTEYFFSNLVVTNQYWNSSIPQMLNAMLSLVIIVPVFSKLSGLNVVWIFKIVYPFIFALVPVGLYTIFKKQTNSRIAFFSCFLFVSIFMFFLEMPYLARQEIGELYFVIMIMLMVEKNLNQRNLMILTVIFIPALLVSHYSMDYIYIFLVLSSYIIVLLRNLNLPRKIHFLGRWSFTKFFFVKNEETDTFTMRYKLQLILLISITAIYYILVSSSELFNLTIFTMHSIVSLGLSYIFNPGAHMALGIVTGVKSPLRIIALVLQLIIQAVIAVGILLLIYRRTGMKFNENYSIFSVMGFLMLILVLVVPFLAGALNPDRFYQIALILLSVFFVVGWIALFNLLNRILGSKWTVKSVYNISLKFIAVFLAISLIFNSGAVYEIFRDNPSNMSLHSSMDGPQFNEMEITGVEWLMEYKVYNLVYADGFRFLLLNGYNYYTNNIPITNTTVFQKNSYLFLGTYNIDHNQIGIPTLGANVLKYIDDSNLTSTRDKVFDDGGSQVYQGINQ